jgi:hypothetical protein
LFAAVVIASIALLDGSMDRAPRRILKSASSFNDGDYRGDPCRMRRDGQKDVGKKAPICCAWLSVTQLDIAVVGGTYLAGFLRGDQGKARLCVAL